MLGALSLPLMCAPMSYVSSVPLALACCRAGIVAGWQGGPITRLTQFREYIEAFAGLEAGAAPPIVNLPAGIARMRDGEERLALLEEARAPLVLSSVGDPRLLVERVHGWGGRVIHDVTTMRHAEKAIAAGVDGLMVTCAGAGGHTGFLTPMAFVPAVRRIWPGLLIVAGGIADARGMAAALVLGGDIACMGTRFIATPESGVVHAYRAMVADHGADDIVVSAGLNGVPANWMRASLEQAGVDPASRHDPGADMHEAPRAWRDVYSAGHSVALIDSIEPVADVVRLLLSDFAAIYPGADWRERLHRISAQWAE